MARLTQRVLTICIEQIPTIMQELVVEIPPTQICLMRRVARAVLVYIEAAEAAAAEEAEEVGDQGDQGGQDQIQGHFMDCNPNFVYFCIFIQL